MKKAGKRIGKQLAAILLSFAGLLSGCTDRFDTPAWRPEGGRQVDVRLAIAFDSKADGATLYAGNGTNLENGTNSESKTDPENGTNPGSKTDLENETDLETGINPGSETNLKNGNKRSGKSIPANEPPAASPNEPFLLNSVGELSFHPRLVSSSATKAGEVYPDKLYNLEIRQYNPATGACMNPSAGILSEQEAGASFSMSCTEKSLHKIK